MPVHQSARRSDRTFATPPAEAAKRQAKRGRDRRRKASGVRTTLGAVVLTIALHTQVEVTIPEFALGPVTIGPISVGNR